MARHASLERHHRIAAWPIVLAGVVLVLAGATVGFFVFLNSNRHVAACTGSTVLPVVASSGAAAAVDDAARAFNATKPVARSTCVSVSVSKVMGSVAVAALATGWKGQPTAAPALWVSDSAADVATLDASNSAMTAGHSTTNLATSPVVLAVRSVLPAGAVSWKQLALGSAPGIVPAIPDPSANSASADALESIVAAASSGAPQGAVDADAVQRATPVFARLAATVPRPPASTQLALADLASGQSQFSAVPVLEADLATFNAAAGKPLTAVYPTGPTAGEALLPVPLTADWVTAAMSDAAAAFDAFLQHSPGLEILAAHHLRTATSPATAVGVSLSTPVTPLRPANSANRSRMLDLWAAAAGHPVVTSSPPATHATPAASRTRGPSMPVTPGAAGSTAGAAGTPATGAAGATGGGATSTSSAPVTAAIGTAAISTAATSR